MPEKVTRANLEKDLKTAGDPRRALTSAAYFKTGKGEYGEGDIFLGISTPMLRKITLRFRELPLADIAKLLSSKIHECRSAALEILVSQYKRGSDEQRAEIVDFYLQNTAGINNWDLVDGSAPYILGEHLRTRPRRILRKLARSQSLWERRIAIIATMRLVRNGELEDALSIAEMLLDDDHDLIHKAVGWVLREVGRQDRGRLIGFLQTHYRRLPRTALRYAIEHFAPSERKKMLAGEFR
ncbi:3-methyladenine DNA glycosylase AlkD [Silvibacterium bohemicum]|uniref:3-methyladenine DNA glycosylase AlkD n=1 Tax=Silvibacterium bohemicum TaxID=1577686 RepID=A0A841K1T3_9BACT|nr:DNA alkylation repair protein [Silvibacterium bohemicum]MBB6144608.1 3-methyladenine DNA glycosylase AlkD [Silvibacterium bohemicum]